MAASTARAKPSKSQEAAIRYFADGTRPNGVRTTHMTYQVCRERGWLEATDTFPFHRATSAGRAAVGLPVEDPIQDV
jgi:hypothetical protein